MSGTIDVAILIGSAADWDVMKATVETLREFGVSCETRVLAAGTRVFIAAAGMAAHLAGAVAAQTTRPVLGVPLATSELNGLDALLATVQMPAGIPVGTLAIGRAGAINAALLAVSILANERPELREKLRAARQKQAEEIRAVRLT
jgi:5-(carboxyamino)imidazole ribonucleotide mutase